MFINLAADFFKLLPSLILFLICTTFIGSVLTNKRQSSLAFPIGLLFIVVTYSIFVVGGKTIFILLLPFFIFYLIKIKSYSINFKYLLNNTWANSKQLLLPIIMLFLSNYILTLKLENYPYFEVCRDDIYYSRLSTFIYDFGIETYNIGWYKEVSNLGNSQYHFFELYLNSLLSKLTFQSSLTTYIFYISPLLQLTFYVAIIHLKSIFKISTKRNYLIAFAILLTILSPAIKFTITFLPVILLILSIKKSNIVLSLFLTILLFTLNPIFVFILPPLYICYIICLKITKSKIEKQYYLLIILSIFLAIAYFSVSNFFKGDLEMLNGGMIDFNYIIEYYSDMQHIKMTLHFILKYLLKSILIFPLLSVLMVFLIAVNFKKIRSDLPYLLFLFILLVISIIASSTIHFLRESAQIFQMSYFIFIFVTIAFLYVKHYSSAQKNINIIVLLCIVSSIIYARKDLNILNYSEDDHRFGKYSISYFDNIKEVIGESNDLKIVRFLNQNQYQDTERVTPYNSFEGYYVAFFSDQFYFHTFNLKDIPDKKSLNNFYNYNKNGLLKKVYDYNYLNKYNSLSDEELLLQFLKDHDNVNYAIIEKGAVIPSNLNELIEIKIVDTKSQEVFLKLKNKND